MSESSGPADDSINEQLILAREVGRGIQPPPFDGFTVDLQGQRVNLWWHDRHLRSRAFSDAFVTRRNQLVLVVASVSDPLDPTGLALSIRAFLRARLSFASESATLIAELEEWAGNDPQWAGCCRLGIVILQQNHELVYACYGNMQLAHRDAGGRVTEIPFPDSLPLLFGAYRESEPVEFRNLTLEPGEAFTIISESGAPESAFDGGKPPSFASACVTARKESMMTIDQNETCIPMTSPDSDPSIDDQINAFRARLEEPIRQSHERTFSILIERLMERARREGNAAEQDRLITHGLAIQQQWLPMAVRDELLVEWQNALAPERLKFLRRYNLFAKNDIHLKSHERWTQLWARYSKLMSLEHRIREWATMKNATVNPLLAIAKEDNAKTGQFGPLDEKLYQQLNDIYLHYEKLLREYHTELVCGLNMQGSWMDEWGYLEPGSEMDRADPISESK